MQTGGEHRCVPHDGCAELRKAQSKLLLERVVMKKGAFLQERGEEKKTSMNSDELLDLLQSDISKDDIAQRFTMDMYSGS